MDNDNFTKLEGTTDATLLARDLKCRHGPILRDYAGREFTQPFLVE